MSDLPVPRAVDINSADFRFHLDGVDYRWYGGFGAILQSVEKGVKRNEVRMIAGLPFYAYIVERKFFFWSEISWSIKGVSAQWIRDFRKQLFHCNE